MLSLNITTDLEMPASLAEALLEIIYIRICVFCTADRLITYNAALGTYYMDVGIDLTGHQWVVFQTTACYNVLVSLRTTSCGLNTPLLDFGTDSDPANFEIILVGVISGLYDSGFVTALA